MDQKEQILHYHRVDGLSLREIARRTGVKLHAVLIYVRKHSGCRSTEIISHTSYSMSTVERCLAELKNQGLIEYSGSKKKGGYSLINADK